jgi:apolipoprotein N-acyltransferase
MSAGPAPPKRNSKLETRNSKFEKRNSKTEKRKSKNEIRDSGRGKAERYPRVPKFRLSNFDFRLLSSYAACVLSGLLLVACFPPLHGRGLVWVACLPLLLAVGTERRLKRAFLLGYVCGVPFFALSCHWFLIVMESYGHLPPALSVLVLILFVIIDSVFFGGFGLAVGWAARRSARWALAASPFLWVVMELARTYLITGFAWNLLGYAVQSPGLRQVAAFTGVYGLSFLAVATSALLAWVVLETRNSKVENRKSKIGNLKSETRISNFVLPAAALVLWVACLLLVGWRLAPPPVAQGRELAVLVQPDVPLDDNELESWVPWHDPTELQRLVQFSEAALTVSISENPPADANRQSPIASPPGPPLLVWAEIPAPFYFTRDPVFRNAVETMARETHAYVVVNTVIPLDERGEEITNSAITVNPEGRPVSRYDKIHLVPFGEYVPWWALPGLVHKIAAEVGTFVPGSSYPVVQTPDGGVGVFICYEAIIPQLARQLVTNGAGVLVNISNDAWYGNSAAAAQHLEMARLRAIENHRYLLRATNNGITVAIDPYGRVLQELPRYRRMVLPAHFDFVTQQTFYSAHGDVFAWLAAAVAGLMLIGAYSRQPTAVS